MKTSPEGRALIEEFEGLFLHAYRDIVGVWTIGYGHTSAAGPPKVYPGMTISKEQADAFLAADLAGVENNINLHTKVSLNQNQFDAVVSFDFNTGGYDRSNVLRAINSRAFGEVPRDLMMWNHAGGRVVGGLTRRRAAEGALFAKAPTPEASSFARGPKCTTGFGPSGGWP